MRDSYNMLTPLCSCGINSKDVCQTQARRTFPVHTFLVIFPWKPHTVPRVCLKQNLTKSCTNFQRKFTKKNLRVTDECPGALLPSCQHHVVIICMWEQSRRVIVRESVNSRVKTYPGAKPLVFPHIFVWGSCFWFCIPSAASSSAPPFVTHTTL